MALRPLEEAELQEFGLENDANVIKESGTLKPITDKQVNSLKLLKKGTMAYDLAEKYKESWGLDPEAFAQRTNVKDTTGLPDFILDKKPEIIKETIQKTSYNNAPKVDFAKMESEYPITGNFLGANMGFAWDDIDNLKRHESLFRKMQTSFGVGMDIGTAGRLATGQMYFDEDNPALEKEIVSLEKSIEARKTELSKSNLFGRAVQGLGEITGQQAETLRNVGIYGTIGTILGFLSPVPGGAAAGAAIGAKFGAAQSIYQMEAGHAWREYKDIPGVDDDVAKVGASIVGLINTGSEMLQIGSVAAPFKTAFAKMGITGAEATKRSMLMLLQRPTVRESFKTFAQTYGATYLENIGQEVLQQATTQTGGMIVSGITGVDTQYTDINQFVASLVEEAKGAAEMFALVPMLGSMTNLTVDLNRANTAIQNQQVFEELASSAKDSKVRQRLPRAYREMIASATKDGGLETIYIDSEKFQTVFGQEAPNVAEELGITEEYEQSLKNGGDIAVNTATYAEKIAPTTAHEQLSGGIRLKEGEMTADEAQAFLAEYEANKQASIEEAKRVIEAEDEWGADLEMVRQETKDMLLSNGLSSEEAEQNSLLWASWINVLAKERGVKPSEQNMAIGMRVGLPETTANGTVLGQSVWHGTPYSEIEKFQLDKIGTGEGAQAFGWGLYFTEKKEIAQYYRERLTREQGQDFDNVKYEGKTVLDWYNYWEKKSMTDKSPQSKYYDYMSMLEDYSLGRWEPNEIIESARESELSPEAIEWFNKTIAKSQNRPGALYSVEILDGEYFLWDQPLNKQSSKLTEFIKKYKNILSVKKEITGGDFYALLSEKLGSDKEASLALKEAGLLGIKYLDGTSRDDGNGGYNYVLFDEESIQIINKYKQDKRGQVAISQGKSIISFFQSRDASTFAHEMGHIMLSVMESYSSQFTPDSQMFKDWQVLREYLELAEGETLASLSEDRLTLVQEKFARTFEQYLMTGEAPSVGLRNTFRKFKTWLIGIYKELSALNVEMSPEVKTVFDRMLATEDEITQVETLANYNKDVSKMENLGVTEEEAELYSTLKGQAEQEARETMLARLMKPIERMFKKDKKAEYDRAIVKKEKEIRGVLEKQPVHIIRGLLGIGDKKGGLRFNFDDAVGVMGDLAVSLGMGERGVGEEDVMLPSFNKAWFKKDGGVDPEAIAIEYGYSSASEMFLDLATAPLIDSAVKAGAKAEVDAELNTGIDPASVREQAEKAIRGKNRLELLGLEWLILTKKGRVALKLASAKARIQAAKNSAEKYLDGRTWKDAINFKRFIALERKAALAAERAILKGDMDTALAQKELQIINAALAAESMKRKSSADIMVKYLKKMGNRTRKQTFGIMPDALDQIDTLLETYEFKNIPQEEMAVRKDIAEWIAEQQAMGVPIDLPYEIQRQAKIKNYNSMTYSEIEGLYNTIKAIEKIGKGIMLFKKAEEAQTYDEAVERLKESLEKKKVTRQYITSSDPNMSVMESLHKIPDALDSSLLKAQALFLMLDGTSKISMPGAFTEIFWRPFAEADDVKRVMLRDYTGRIDDAIRKHFKPQKWGKFLSKKVFISEIGMSLTGEQIFCVYMNWGTENNRVRLMEGKKWSEQQVQAIISKLDKKTLDLGQDIRDIIGTLFPLMVQLNRDMLGYAPKMEEATPITTAHGTYRGGYYPLVADYGKSVDIRSIEEYETGLYQSSPAYRASTRQGAYKARAKHAEYQVRLDLGGLKKHIDEVIHDLAFRRAVVDANKLASNKELRLMISERVGKVGLQVLDGWLKDVARPPSTASDPYSTMARFLRHGVTSAMIMFKFTVLALQQTGWFNTAEVLRGRTGRAIAMYYARPQTWHRDWQFVMDMSPFMVERNGLIDSNMREVLLDAEYGKTPSRMKEFARGTFNFFDGLVSIPTWLEGYRIGLEMYKGDEDKAVGYADDIVRQTQGGAGIIDQAAIQRTNNEWKRVFTMFYQYLNTTYNLMRRAGHKVESIRDYAGFAGSMFILVVAPSVIEGLMRDDDQPEEDEEGMFGGWGTWASVKTATYMMGTVPILRDVGSNALARMTGVGYGGDLRVTPLVTPIESFIKTALVLTNEEKDWKDKAKQTTESLAYIKGFPIQLHTIAWNLYNYLNDDQSDLDWTDLYKKQYGRK